MKKHTQYLHCKPSNINGLGDIPTHWEVVKLKYIAKTVLGKMLCTTPIEGYYKKPYLKSKNVQWLSVDIAEVEEMYFSEKELTQYRIAKNDLLLSEGGEVGKTCIWADELEECYIQNSVHKVTFYQEYNPTFYLYLFFYLGKIGFFNSIVNRVSIAHLTQEKLRHIYCIVPPPTEQTAIVTYLNHKLADIDTFIAKKQRLITLLQEQKAAMINKAVTKGLNEHEMRPSGIAWLGDIPTHWEVRKLKYVASYKSGDAITSENINEVGQYAVYGGNGLRGYTNNYNHDGFYILIGRQGALCGNINYASGKFWASEHAIVVYQNKHNPIWLGEVLRMANLNQLSQTAAQPGISITQVKDVKIPVPPLTEQIAIVSHIEAESARIDKAISLIERELTLVQEYRTALIAEAVTGKIDCNG